MNAVVSSVANTRPVSSSFKSAGSQNPSVKLSNQVGAPAHNRKASTRHWWNKKHKADDKLVAACMPGVAQAELAAKKSDPNYRKRLVTQEKSLPENLISNDSQILKAIDDLDFAILHGKAPKPAGTAAVEQVRAAIRRSCGDYTPVPVSNMYATGVDPKLPFLADGFGILCASGTAGYANFRGRLCTKVCKVSMDETDKSARPAVLKDYGFVSVQDLMAGIREVNQIAQVGV